MPNKSIITRDDFSIYVNFIGHQNLYLTVSVTKPSQNLSHTVDEIYTELIKVIRDSKMQIVHERLFGNISVEKEIIESRKKIMDKNAIGEDLPITFVEGQPCWGIGLSGIQIRAVSQKSEGDIWTIYEKDKPCGRGWKQNGNTYLMLQNIHGVQTEQPSFMTKEHHTRYMFERAENILQTQGASYKNVVRTWIYLSKILDWYDSFNDVRNDIYKQFKLLPVSKNGYIAEDIYMPASTGIEGNNPLKAAGVMDVLAVIPASDFKKEVNQTAGVKQKSPFRYKSAFSRATSVYEKDLKHVLISGTAAIDEKGESLFIDNSHSQIVKTLEIVDNLVRDEGASMHDIYEATVFLKNAADLPLYQKILQESGLSELPAVVMVADVCRDELLFEMDAALAVNKLI